MVTPGKRLRRHVKKRGAEYAETGVGEAVNLAASAANLAVPGLGLLLLLGKWGTQRGHRELLDRRAADGLPRSAGAAAVDELAPALERLGAAGLPLVVVVEDVHVADPTLVELLARLLAAQQSRVLLITTAWTGLLSETSRPAAELLARVPAERVQRIQGDCVALEHLRVGTQAQNMAQMHSRGRGRRRHTSVVDLQSVTPTRPTGPRWCRPGPHRTAAGIE